MGNAQKYMDVLLFRTLQDVIGNVQKYMDVLLFRTDK